MIERKKTGLLLENLQHFPVVGILGPRQVGKTTLARAITKLLAQPYVHLDLELDSDLRKLDEAEAYLRHHQDKLVVIDEIQRLPRLFPLLRALVDERRRPGRFLILGSASPHIIRDSSESLAGRIAYTELSPLSFTEISDHLPLERHWVRGGFPEPLLMENEQMAWRWMDNFLTAFLERDLRILGYDIPPTSLRRFLQMLGDVHGNLLNISELSRSMGLSTTTLSRYLDILEGSFLIHRLTPFFQNTSKRLVKSPKLYFSDSGLLHSLAGISSFDLLLGSRLVGASWEGYVVEQIRREAPEQFQFFFYRTQAGAEIDLVIQSPKGPIYAVEIKRSLSSAISRGFYQGADDLNAKGKFVIVKDGERFPKSDGTWVCNLSDFLTSQLPSLV